jgi:hypothetical protein
MTRAAVALGAIAVAAPAQAHAAPKIQQLVVFKNGEARQTSVVAAKASVKVGKKRCAVGAGTPLAALWRSHISGIRLKDYGACSSKPADAAGLYVSRIRKDSAKGANGWVYKVGNRVAPAGAGDPTGPFGNGRLKPRARVTWFYCRMKANGCQRTLAISKVETPGGGQVRVTVRAYDNYGKGRAAAGATVRVGSVSAKADSKGVATLTAAPGKAALRASGKGVVRSFGEQIEVK